MKGSVLNYEHGPSLSVPVSRDFDARLRALNSLDEEGFSEWIFDPAMLFGSTVKWWGDRGKRNTPHEGLDLRPYRTGDGVVHRLDAGAKVPVMFDGEVVNVIDDFLGKSVFVRHGGFETEGCHLYTIYGHIVPSDSAVPGSVLAKGSVIGVISAGRRNDAADIAHLHMSVAWIPDSVNAGDLDWNTVGDPTRVVLIDPLGVITWRYSIVADL
ncbi:MAG: hypothetical protein HYX85_02815 [Chloroflexi bacterium]|nr:hypothetical protein [Chloroflexota bacterium]